MRTNVIEFNFLMFHFLHMLIVSLQIIFKTRDRYSILVIVDSVDCANTSKIVAILAIQFDLILTSDKERTIQFFCKISRI